MDNKNFFKNKKIVITGGTGSIGSQILKYLIPCQPSSIKVFSRDEYKQHKLRYRYSDIKLIDYILGDVRDLESLKFACQDTDIIFHCAALKHVPISEEMPEEFIKTNILGSYNVYKAAISNNVPIVVSISSDKAVNPSNLMGLTKAVQEKIFSSHYLKDKNESSKFINVRFGNVIGTHGSLFPIIYHQILNKKPITITDSNMTRFFMSEKEAIDLIFWAAINGNDGETIVKKMKSVKITDLVQNFLSVLKASRSYPVKVIGIRIGEKIDETLITETEYLRTKDKNNYFVIAPYTSQDIKEDVLKIPKKNVDVEMKKFSSNHIGNALTTKEIKLYIKTYVDHFKFENEII